MLTRRCSYCAAALLLLVIITPGALGRALNNFPKEGSVVGADSFLAESLSRDNKDDGGTSLDPNGGFRTTGS